MSERTHPQIRRPFRAACGATTNFAARSSRSSPGPTVRKPGQRPADVRTPCPVHAETGGCDALAARLLADENFRHGLFFEMEDEIWQFAFEEIGEDTLAPFVALFDTSDRWRFGEAPIACVERSALLWNAFVERETLASRVTPIPALVCPVETEFFEAQARAPVTVLANQAGVLLRDVLAEERPSFKPDPRWPARLIESAQHGARFLARMPVFRGHVLLDEFSVSRVVLDVSRLAEVAKLLRAAHAETKSRDFGWQLAAAWIGVAAEAQAGRDVAEETRQ